MRCIHVVSMRAARRFVLLTLSALDLSVGSFQNGSAVALLLPDPQSPTKLKLNPKASALLSELRGPLSVVAVIGQYRSGKSFLLNQLANVPCSEGFAVGHRRETMTKGVCT